MYRFSFVILHYLSYNATRSCIDSILQTYSQSAEISYNIVVVDNASPNNSYEQLLARYENNSIINFICSTSNVGFAKGNNLGYVFATQTLHSDFVIITNNDTEFFQPSFLSTIVDIYAQNTSGLIGPDIIDTQEQHQNPYRTHLITDSELNRWLFNRQLWLAFLRIDKLLGLSKHLSVFRNYYNARAAAGKPTTSWKNAAKNVVLQGACIIFTPLFIDTIPQYAFYPDTFMYCEEDIIAFLCNKHNIETYYAPSLCVRHIEAISTKLSYDSLQEKDFFLTQNIIKSLRVFKKLRKNYLD